MPTSTRYDSIETKLASALPDLRPRLAKPLIGVLTGMSQAVSATQQRVADAMPFQTKQNSKIQRFRRLLDNANLTPEAIYHPIVTAALHGLSGQRVHLLLDRVVLNEHQNVLVVSVAFRRRSIPLAWQVLEHGGSRRFEDQTTILETAAALLPERVRVVGHADSEFRAIALFQWIRAHDWDAFLGVRGQVLVSPDPNRPGQALETGLGHRDTVVYLNTVWITEDRQGPVNVMAWWDKNDRNELICYAVMTNLPATWASYCLGKRRMGIETMFRDWQSGGFELGKSAIQDRERFFRLILLVCLIYLWFVCVGRWLVKRSNRLLVDTGTSHAWHRRLFRMAVAWQNRCRTFDQSFPLVWVLYA